MFGNNIATFLNSFELSLLTKDSVTETYTSTPLYSGSIYLPVVVDIVSARSPIAIKDI